MVTRQQIQDAETLLLGAIRDIFGFLLSEFDKGQGDGFLEEISAPIPVAADEPEPTPSIPTDAELEAAAIPAGQRLVDRAVQVLELEKESEAPQAPAYEQDPEWQLVTADSETYQKVCAWLINNEKSRADLHRAQADRKIRFDKKDLDHLFNLIWYREELLKGKDGAFSLRDIINQADTTDAEKPLWEALAKTTGQ